MCPSATDRHGCVSPGLDRHVRFPHDASGQAGSHSHIEQHLVSQNSDTSSLLGLSMLPLDSRVFAASGPVAVESGHECGCGGCRAFAADVVALERYVSCAGVFLPVVHKRSERASVGRG